MLKKYLYHGSRHPELLTALEPRMQAQVKNGVLSQWVFATHRRDQAVLFSSSFVKGGSFLRTLDDSDSGTLALFVKGTRTDLFNTPINGLVYRVPAESFERVYDKGKPLREWVSPQKFIPVDQKTVTRTTSFNDVMESGVQIFTVSPQKPIDRLKDFTCLSRQEIAPHLIGPSPTLVWENLVRNIKPDKKLRDLAREAETMLVLRGQSKMHP